MLVHTFIIKIKTPETFETLMKHYETKEKSNIITSPQDELRNNHNDFQGQQASLDGSP